MTVKLPCFHNAYFLLRFQPVALIYIMKLNWELSSAKKVMRLKKAKPWITSVVMSLPWT